MLRKGARHQCLLLLCPTLICLKARQQHAGIAAPNDASRSEERSLQYGLTSAAQQLGAVLGEDGDLCFFKDNAAPVVAEGTYPHQVVMEVGHHIPGGDR